MSEFPRLYTFPDPLCTVSTCTGHSLAGAGITSTGLGNVAYPTANLAIFIPFRITRPVTFSNMFVANGTTVSGNVDVGVYSGDGTRIVSAGGTAQTGANATQLITVATTEIDTGLFYLAIAMDNTTGILTRVNATNAAFLSFCGVAQMASAYPLPATATFATVANAYAPVVGLTNRSFA